MATWIDAGRVKILPKGVWSATAQYDVDDIVTYNHYAYLCMKANTGIPPVDDSTSEYWEQFGASVDGDGTTTEIVNGQIKVKDYVSKTEVNAVDAKFDTKADNLTYDENNSLLYLKSGSTVLSSVEISGGSASSVIHVDTHETTWKGNQNVLVEIFDDTADYQGHFDASGDYFHRVNTIGEHIVKVTDEDGSVYQGTVNVTTIGAVYYIYIDATAEWQNWVNAGGLSASSYESLDEVLADETAIRTLMTKHASVDYLTATTDTEMVSTIINNDVCAKWINLRDYALDTLYSVASIKTLMDTADKYGYGEWALIGQVPTMTSNTAPSGEAFASAYYGSGFEAYKAFDKTISTISQDSFWAMPQGTTSGHIGYKFTNPICVKSFFLAPTSWSGSKPQVKDYKIQASNDGFVSDIHDLYSGTYVSSTMPSAIQINNNDSYMSYRAKILSSYDSAWCGVQLLQFYAWSAKGAVPIMTSDSAPYGTVLKSSEGGGDSSRVAWRAFDGDDSTQWQSTNSSSQYIEYKFTNPISVRRIGAKLPSVSQSYTLKYSDDGVNYTDAGTFTLPSSIYSLNNVSECGYHLYWRMTANFTGYAGFKRLQFYGRSLSVSVPTMTSNTAPWGEVVYSTQYNDATTLAYKVFDKNETSTAGHFWSTADGDNAPLIGYDFKKPTKVKVFRSVAYSSRWITSFYVVAKNNASDAWTRITEDIGSITASQAYVGAINTDTAYRYWAIKANTWNQSGLCYHSELNFYGLDYSERTERTYLYDHGVELVQMAYSSLGTVAQNNGNEIEIDTNGQTATRGFVETQSKVDFTNKSLLRCTIKDAIARSDNTSNFGQIGATDLNPMTNSESGNRPAYVTITASIMPNAYLDISSANGEYYPYANVYAHSGRNRLTFNEWWLE